jgi:DNA-binding NtrC family response regulator/tetratricopeptide (TPR) repeat protein
VGLIADRFVKTTDGRVVDLATGDDVVLTYSCAGGPADQLRWAARCDWFQRLFHPSLAQLLDYGTIGESRRFEAWRCANPYSAAASREASRVVRSAALFLRSCGLTAFAEAEGPRVGGTASNINARPVVIPDAAAGYPDGVPEPPDARIPAELCGIARVERRGLGAVSELFEMPAAAHREPQVVCVWGPEGSGKTTAIYELSRAARLNGFVPVCVRLIASPLASVLAGRTVCVIDDEQATWRRGLVHVSIRSPHPHVVLCTSPEDPRGVPGVRLTALSPPALLAAVRPAQLATDPRIRKAAERADGVPGRFGRYVRGTHYDQVSQRMFVTTAAERAPIYGVVEAASSDERLVTQSHEPGAREVCGLRRQLTAAREQLAAGRHAPGDRELRRAIGALARRGDWAGAAEGSLALAASLLKRGRAREARALVDGALTYCQRTSDDDPSIEAATLVGAAWIDLARLGEAESVLTGATSSSLGHGRPSGIGLGLALARCRFWQGKYDDADRALAALRATPAAPSTTIRFHALRARVAVGRLDFTEAMSSAADAVRRAEALAEPSLIAEATCAAGFAHLAVGDLTALQADVDRCVAAARAARDPLRAFRARLMRAEQFRRAGRKAAAQEVLNRVTRLAHTRLPPILRRRYDLIRDLLTLVEAPQDIVARHAATSGLPALTLYGSAPGSSCSFAGEVDDALAMLRACQSSDDEEPTLTVVCEQAQRRLEAAAVAFFGLEGAVCVRLAGTPSRLDAAIADRAATSGVPIPPHRLDDRVEAAVPVRYGGAMVGALAARWTLSRSPDGHRAIAVLTMAAAAAAPLVQSMLSVRSRSAVPSTDGLLGVSPVMTDLRRAADRAAQAPFAVLVEGESGSGKELVARAIHRGGSRRDRPFRTLNCAALPDELVESELFGHARGAFTGAVAERVGVFEEAHSGTLFLDEIGELSLRAQAKLLRVIQEGELRRIGENVSRRIDVRIVSATNRDLRKEAAAGRFRADLLYRLDVVRIVVPSLRDRREDIPLLVEHFWRDAAARVGSRSTLSPAAVASLARYDWPGNVRELQNVLAALAVRVGRRGIVAPEALPPQFGAPVPDQNRRLDAARRVFDERFIRAALLRTGGSRARAALDLGISRQGLTKLMTRLGIADRGL